MVSLLLAEPGLRRWQQVLFDVDVLCRVSVSASTYDLHYDQKRNACRWTTGDLVQTGEGGEVQEEMEEGQQMESGVEGARSVELWRQANSVNRKIRGRIYFFTYVSLKQRMGRIRWQIGFYISPSVPARLSANKTILINMLNLWPLHDSMQTMVSSLISWLFLSTQQMSTTQMKSTFFCSDMHITSLHLPTWTSYTHIYLFIQNSSKQMVAKTGILYMSEIFLMQTDVLFYGKNIFV